MHSFQPSRGRIFFEVLSALAIAASLAGAWAQTGASALLAAAIVAGLSGLVHALDLGRSRSTVAEEPQRIDFEPEAAQIVVPMVAVEERERIEPEPETPQIVVPMVAVEELQVVEIVEAVQSEVAEAAEPAPPRSGSGRRSGGSRKGSGRRTKAAKEPKAVEPAPADEAVVPWPTAVETDRSELSPASGESGEEFSLPPDEEAAHPQIAPLFEPEPFARMPRRAFGRKAG